MDYGITSLYELQQLQEEKAHDWEKIEPNKIENNLFLIKIKVGKKKKEENEDYVLKNYMNFFFFF